MAGHDFTPRKQRTRDHIIADQSVNHLERFIIDAGFTAQRLVGDYGYDLVMTTFDQQGYVEPGFVRFQLKASDTLPRSGADTVFDVDIRDYHLWVQEPMPVILVLHEASSRRSFWLHFRVFFEDDPSRHPKKGAKTVRVRVPLRRRVNRQAIVRMRGLKAASLAIGGIKLWRPR